MNTVEIILFIALFIVLTASIILIDKVNKMMITSLKPYSNTQAQAVADKYLDSSSAGFDITIGMIFLGIVIALIVAESLVQFHPIFLGLSILSIILVLFYAPIFSNLYGYLMQNVITDGEYQITTSIWQNLPLILLVVCIIIVIIQLIK